MKANLSRSLALSGKAVNGGVLTGRTGRTDLRKCLLFVCAFAKDADQMSALRKTPLAQTGRGFVGLRDTMRQGGS